MAEADVRRVLVVDDNPIIRDSVMAATDRLNQLLGGDPRITLFEAEDGATAWDRIVDNEMHLLIIDLYIPILDGLTLIERVRESSDTASTPILAISASIQDARARSLAAGADQFLQKPIRLVDLVDGMANLLRLDLP